MELAYSDHLKERKQVLKVDKFRHRNINHLNKKDENELFFIPNNADLIFCSGTICSAVNKM